MRGPAARVYLKIVRSTSRRKRLRTTRAYIRPRRPHHDSESRQDVRARLRRCPRRRGPGGIRRPRERCAGGRMKSTLTFSILYQNALQENRKCAYFTLEQGKDLVLEQMASMGMADARAAEQIVTLDMGNIRKNLNFLQGRGSWLELFKMYCKNVMKADPVSVLVVDSLDVLETMATM